MNYQDLRIVFMGTPEFAVASLEQLVLAGCHIVGVVTAPDKPAGRGMQMQESAVKKYALSQGLHILQPEKLKSPEFLEHLQSLQADLQIVVAFRMLPELVWNMPPMGTVNLHGSLLPQYRGAAPINWAIINGEAYTGVTTFKLQHAIDTGNILLSERIEIETDESAGSLHDKMKAVGARVLFETVKQLAEGSLNEQSQESMINDQIAIHHAPKIFTETCEIDWLKSGLDIYNLVRGLSPYPAAFTELQGKKMKIFVCHFEKNESHLTPGEFETDGKNYLRFICHDGYIYLDDIQLEGKKRMPIKDFLRGYRFNS